MAADLEAELVRIAGESAATGLSRAEKADLAEKAKAKAKSEALKRRNEFQARVNRGKATAHELPRSLIPLFGFTVASKMLLDILSGDLEVRNAKDAAEIAKVALSLAREETGEGAARPEDLTPTERTQKIAAAKEALAKSVEAGGKLAEMYLSENPDLRVVADTPDDDVVSADTDLSQDEGA